jgi:hypothetical protein
MTLAHSPPQATASHFLDDLNEAVRANPVAAGFIGVGVLWMLFGAFKVSVPADATRSVGATPGSRAGAAKQAVADGMAVAESIAGGAARNLSAGAHSAGALARDIGAAGYEALNESGEQAAAMIGHDRDAMNDAWTSSKSAGQEFATSAQKNLNSTMERHPLVLGVIGAGIGAAIASAFPATQTENELMGDIGLGLKENVREFATEAADAARNVAHQTLDEVKEEADTQGLTPSSIRDKLQDIGGRLKTVADAGRRAITDRLS